MLYDLSYFFLYSNIVLVIGEAHNKNDVHSINNAKKADKLANKSADKYKYKELM